MAGALDGSLPGIEAPMDWAERGPCRAQPERMFAEGAAQKEAKAVCAGCPVRLDCLAHALDHREEYSVWGAMTERERRALLRRRPDVRSWAQLFARALGHQDGSLLDVVEPGRTSRGPGTRADRDRGGAG
ncbi:WhiB family transcriptional regulator [Streptomyces sp. NPDC002690]